MSEREAREELGGFSALSLVNTSVSLYILPQHE